MKTILITCFISLFATTISAQNINIKGRIVEMKDGKATPVEFATVALLLEDSTLAKGGTSGVDGKFMIEGVNKGNYILSTSYTGYATVDMALKNLTKSLNLGDVVVEESAVAIKNVEVTASNVIQKIDRQIIMPSESQVKNSANSYDLLNNMMIPRLDVNPMEKTMSVSGGRNVQTRINGIKATTVEVSAIRAKDILRVEYIEDPGSRYEGDNLGAVINIITKRNDSGGLVNLDFRYSPKVWIWGENNVAAKVNHKKSEWGITASSMNRGFNHHRRDIAEEYYLDNQVISRVQEGINDSTRTTMNNVNLSYNLSDPDKYTLNVMFRNDITDVPKDNLSAKLFERGYEDYIFSKTRNKNSSYSPSLDVYYQRTLPRQQSIQLNVVGTIIDSETSRRYTEFTPSDQELASILTDVNGIKRSIIAEGIYDKNINKVKLSLGARHTQMRTENEYRGSNPINSDMDQSKSSAFAEIQGAVKKVNYGFSAGVTRSWFKEGMEEYAHYIFNPTFRLSYAPTRSSFIRYRFSVDPTMPLLSSLTDVEQMLDTIQIVRGNPRLKTYKMFDNLLNYSYSLKKFQGGVNVRYQYMDKPIMESVFVENNKIIIMDENQKYLQKLNTEANLSFRNLSVGSLRDFLSLQFSFGYTHYDSKGNNYRHQYNNYYYNAMAMMSYKKFMLMGQFRKTQNSLFGETIHKGENMTAFMLMYTQKRLQLGAGILFPFTNNYSTGTERVSEVAPVVSTDYIKEAGQLVVIRLSYNFEFGRKYNTKKKGLENKDDDSGIINTNR